MDAVLFKSAFSLKGGSPTSLSGPSAPFSRATQAAGVVQYSPTFCSPCRAHSGSSPRSVDLQNEARFCQRPSRYTCSHSSLIGPFTSPWNQRETPLAGIPRMPSCLGADLGLRVRRGKGRRRMVVRAAGPAGTGVRKVTGTGKKPSSWAEWALIGVGVLYMTLMVFVPTANVFYQAFANGIGPFIANLLDPNFLHAVKMTLLIAGIVVPVNTVFGLIMGIWLTRNDFPGKAMLISFMDLPFSISPVVVGLMLMLLYGRQGIFAPLLRKFGLEVVFACPGMVLATAFVTLPFVVREVIPVLEEMDISEEEAARTMGANEWEVFKDVTLPNIQLGLLYGVTLCTARAMGEFGALSVISGNIIGRTQTLTLFVEAAYKDYNTQGAFSAALLLSVLAIITLFIKNKLEELRAQQMR